MLFLVFSLLLQPSSSKLYWVHTSDDMVSITDSTESEDKVAVVFAGQDLELMCKVEQEMMMQEEIIMSWKDTGFDAKIIDSKNKETKSNSSIMEQVLDVKNIPKVKSKVVFHLFLKFICKEC